MERSPPQSLRSSLTVWLSKCFEFFRSSASIHIVSTFCLAVFILQSRPAMNRQARKQPSTEALVDCPRIQETQRVVSRQGIDRGQCEGLVRGRRRRRIVRLSVSISGGR